MEVLLACFIAPADRAGKGALRIISCYCVTWVSPSFHPFRRPVAGLSLFAPMGLWQMKEILGPFFASHRSPEHSDTEMVFFTQTDNFPQTPQQTPARSYESDYFSGLILRTIRVLFFFLVCKGNFHQCLFTRLINYADNRWKIYRHRFIHIHNFILYLLYELCVQVYTNDLYNILRHLCYWASMGSVPEFRLCSFSVDWGCDTSIWLYNKIYRL